MQNRTALPNTSLTISAINSNGSSPMTNSVKTLRKEAERAGRKREPWHHCPPALAVLQHQSALYNLWHLWKWECRNVGDVSNLTIVQSLFLSFKRSAAIRRTVWSQLKLAYHTRVQTGTSEKTCQGAATPSNEPANILPTETLAYTRQKAKWLLVIPVTCVCVYAYSL